MNIDTKIKVIAAGIHAALSRLYSDRLTSDFHGSIDIKVGVQAGKMTHLNVAGQNFKTQDLEKLVQRK